MHLLATKDDNHVLSNLRRGSRDEGMSRIANCGGGERQAFGHIGCLRRKVDDGVAPRVTQTVRGAGYRFGL